MTTLTDIENMNRNALYDYWKISFGHSPPPKTSQSLMRKVLAFEIQSNTQNRLDKKTRKQIANLQQNIQDSKKTNSHSPQPTIKLKTGSRLLREWQGITHTVDVVENGYVWKDQHYRSLSAIARTITGAHWSGPRFFGINKTSITKPSK